MKKGKKQQKIKELCDFSSQELLEIPLILKLLDKTKSRAKSYDVPFHKNIIVKDFCLKMRPEKEDAFYAVNPLFLQNVRKGNSIIEFLSGGNEEVKCEAENNKTDDITIENTKNQAFSLENISKSERYIIRRGLMKFFDLKLIHLQKNSLSKEDFAVKERIFGEVQSSLKNSLKTKTKVMVFKTSKENGTNVQISYSEKSGAWLIASKNTSLLVRNKNDVKDYDDAEFGLTKDLANHWFKTLEAIGEQQLNSMKIILSANTLVGEFISGNKKNAKILKYEIDEFRFFALVELKNTETCVPPSQTIDFLSKHGLKSVKFEKIIETDSLDILFEELRKVHKNVSESPIDVEGEGCVLYFVIKDDKNNEKVASLCKLKTLEYRLLRKIREKLRKIQDFQKFPKNLLKSYKREAEDLLNESEANVDLVFYWTLAEEFLYQVTQFHSKVNYTKAVNMFSVYIERAAENVKNRLKRNIFKEIDLVALIGVLSPDFCDQMPKEFPNIQIVKGYDRKLIESKEGKILLINETLDNIEDLLKIIEQCDNASVIFIGENDDHSNKFSEKAKSFQNIMKIQTITSNENLIKSAVTQSFNDFTSQIKSKPLKKHTISKKKEALVFIPMGIPCMGKSYFLSLFSKFFTEKGFDFHSISSDATHKELIDEQLKKNASKKNVDFEEIFEKTSKKARTLFMERFSLIMKKIATAKNHHQVFFIDKNHPPNGIDKAMDLIHQDISPNIDLKIIAIAPDCTFGTKVNYLPFSLEFIGKCLKRSLDRPEHDTLGGDAEKVFNVILMFCKMYKGMKMTKEHIKSLGFSDLWLLPYCKNGLFDEKIKKQLENCLTKTGNIKELIEVLKEDDKKQEEEVSEAEFREKLESAWGKMREGKEVEEDEDEEFWDSEEDDESEKSY